MVGGVLCVPDRAHGHPTHLFLFACLLCLLHRGCGVGVLQQGALGVVWGLWGVVDVGDEFVLVLTITAAHVRFLCVAWTL